MDKETKDVVDRLAPKTDRQKTLEKLHTKLAGVLKDAGDMPKSAMVGMMMKPAMVEIMAEGLVALMNTEVVGMRVLTVDVVQDPDEGKPSLTATNIAHPTTERACLDLMIAYRSLGVHLAEKLAEVGSGCGHAKHRLDQLIDMLCEVWESMPEPSHVSDHSKHLH